MVLAEFVYQVHAIGILGSGPFRGQDRLTAALRASSRDAAGRVRRGGHPASWPAGLRVCGSAGVPAGRQQRRGGLLICRQLAYESGRMWSCCGSAYSGNQNFPRRLCCSALKGTGRSVSRFRCGILHVASPVASPETELPRWLPHTGSHGGPPADGLSPVHSSSPTVPDVSTTSTVYRPAPAALCVNHHCSPTGLTCPVPVGRYDGLKRSSRATPRRSTC